MADQLRADFHQPVADAGQRPVLYLLRKGEGAQEVGKVVGRPMKLEPHRVAPHGAARQPGSFDRVLALLDVLLRRATLVVEYHDPVGIAREIGDDKPDAWVKLARVPLDLGDHSQNVARRVWYPTEGLTMSGSVGCWRTRARAR